MDRNCTYGSSTWRTNMAPQLGPPRIWTAIGKLLGGPHSDDLDEGRSQGAASRGAQSSTGTANPPPWQRRWSHQGEAPWLDVRFAPAPLGLKLAAVTSDGKARVFECVNAMDLRAWEPEDIETQTHRPSAASSQPAQPDRTLAAATGSSLGCMSAALDWMCVPFGGGGEERSEALAVGGRGGRLGIWAKSNRWKELVSEEAHPPASGGVKDVAWCPNLCRPYEIVATCGAGARLWRVDFPSADETQGVTNTRKDSGNACRLQLLMELIPAADKACPVWRCSWNLMGTTLALCPESGELSIWKCNASLKWRRECEVVKGTED
eukprot:CAMPEP_0172658560 /NCGR_PEP_ID=MMETSP1074-20121228/2857_1 /TAXON_ID=2916 /ORGANISM="Ceratium fusus, Strain PA161109" /LENGTH=320 /DNA_ID=CAMNT_0013473879 /DNA_START=252 /DNA_END=1215 /DNA_ORIENTATION=+